MNFKLKLTNQFQTNAFNFNETKNKTKQKKRINRILSNQVKFFDSPTKKAYIIIIESHHKTDSRGMHIFLIFLSYGSHLLFIVFSSLILFSWLSF